MVVIAELVRLTAGSPLRLSTSSVREDGVDYLDRSSLKHVEWNPSSVGINAIISIISSHCLLPVIYLTTAIRKPS
jgi:hypothetical protein